MKMFVRRMMVAAAGSLLPLAAVALISPATSAADCENGAWWDPAANACQQPVVPNCPGGWWDPAANTCRPPVSTTPLSCDNGWWWDPVGNACRPPVIPPQ